MYTRNMDSVIYTYSYRHSVKYVRDQVYQGTALVLTHKRHARCQRLLRNISTLTDVCVYHLTAIDVIAFWRNSRTT